MEDIFELSISNKEKDFVKAGCQIGSDVATNLTEVFSMMGYIYEESVNSRIEHKTLLRLCSVIDRTFYTT